MGYLRYEVHSLRCDECQKIEKRDIEPNYTGTLEQAKQKFLAELEEEGWKYKDQPERQLCPHCSMQTTWGVLYKRKYEKESS